MTALLAGLALVLSAVSVHMALKRNQEAAEARAVVWRSVVQLYSELGGTHAQTLWIGAIPMGTRYKCYASAVQMLQALNAHPDLSEAYKRGTRRTEETLAGSYSPIGQLLQERSL